MFFFVGVSLQLSAALFLPHKGHEQCHVRSCSAMSKTSMSHHSRLAEAFSILSEVNSSFLDRADRNGNGANPREKDVLWPPLS